MTCGRPRSPNEVSSAAPCTPACASRSETRASPCSRRIPTSAWTCRRWCCASRAGRSPRCSPATRSTTRCACCSIIRIACARAYTCRRITARRRRSRQRCVPQRVPRRRSSLSGQGTGMVIPRRRRSRHLRGYRRTAPIKTGRWRSHLMAQASSSAPTRTLYLLHGEDSFRIRLRAGELISALLAGSTPTRGDLASRELTPTSTAFGLVRIDARSADPDEIVIAGQSQGLFAAPDERRVVLVEHAEALARTDVVERFPEDAALVLVAPEPMRSNRTRARRTKPAAPAEMALLDLVESAGGTVERYDRLLPPDVVRRDIRTAAPLLERLLGEGNAPQQILALLLWQFRVLLFASRDPRPPEAERMAKAIRSSAGAILRYTQYARGLGPKDITRAY